MTVTEVALGQCVRRVVSDDAEHGCREHGSDEGKQRGGGAVGRRRDGVGKNNSRQSCGTTRKTLARAEGRDQRRGWRAATRSAENQQQVKRTVTGEQEYLWGT